MGIALFMTRNLRQGAQDPLNAGRGIEWSGLRKPAVSSGS
jgi:hypothetical protein